MFHPLAVLLVFIIIHQTLSLPSPTTHPLGAIGCDNWPIHPLNFNDCVRLVAQLNAAAWVRQNIAYGPSERGPGKLPLVVPVGTCLFTMQNLHQPAVDTERLRLSDYMPEVESAMHLCLVPGAGYDLAWTVLGADMKFLISMSGMPSTARLPVGGGNVTVGRWRGGLVETS